MMTIVQEKLSWPLEAPADLDASSIAILSPQLLDLSPATVAARRYEHELVGNHLRMLYSVRQDGYAVVTGSSPEPLIAEASAQMMNHVLLSGIPFMDLWSLLEKFIDHGLAWQGAVEVLIGRSLSISAMDRAIDRLAHRSELRYQTPVSVTDYYKALLTDEAWETLRRSVPANCAGLSALSADKSFEDAFKMHTSTSPTMGRPMMHPIRDACAWAYWLRGTAIFCQLNQELTDRMIPMYFPEHGAVSPRSISANLDQDMTGESVNPIHFSVEYAEDLSIFSRGTMLLYIAAVHCYALTENQGLVGQEPPPCSLRTT